MMCANMRNPLGILFRAPLENPATTGLEVP